MCSFITDNPALLKLFDSSILWAGVCYAIYVPLAYFVLGFPFDRKTAGGTKVSPDYWFGPLSTFLLRPISYAVKITLQTKAGVKASRNSNIPIYAADWADYGDFDFRGNANWFQRLFAYSYVFLLMFCTWILGIPIAFCDI